MGGNWRDDDGFAQGYDRSSDEPSWRSPCWAFPLFPLSWYLQLARRGYHDFSGLGVIMAIVGASAVLVAGFLVFGLTGTFYTSGNEREPLERKESDMTKKRHTPEQIVTLLRQVEVAVANGKGTPQACKEAAITEQTYYRWRKEYGGLKLAQAKRLKELEKENSRLKHVVAELSLEKQILREVAQGNS